jgi:hypothetical protein
MTAVISFVGACVELNLSIFEFVLYLLIFSALFTVLIQQLLLLLLKLIEDISEYQRFSADYFEVIKKYNQGRTYFVCSRPSHL